MFHGFFPILSTSDPERLAAFYCDSFDFHETYRFPAEGRADFVVVTLGETALAFTREGPDVRRLELCIETEDVDGAVARADARVLHAPALQEWGDRTAWIADPDGNVVQLFKPQPRDT